MKRRIGTLALILLGCGAASSWASEFTDGFETYVAGTSVHAQGGWKGWDNDPNAGAPVSNRVARSGRNAIEIVGSTDLVHEFNLTGGKWVLTAYQYVPSGAQGVTCFILMNRYADNGPYDWSVQTEYDLTAGTITPGLGDNGVHAKIVYDQWVEIRVAVDLTANSFEEYYHGIKIAFGPWNNNAHGTLQALDLFANDASSVYYDDIKIDSGSETAGTSCFPRPAYDSGWITTPMGSPSQLCTKVLLHGLGGDTDNYVVDLQRKVSGIAGPMLGNQGFGSTFYYNFLTNASVSVSAPYSAVDLVTSIRVRIWVYDCTTTPSTTPTPK